MPLLVQPEEKLISDLMRGCPVAFTTLYRVYAPALRKLLMRMVKDHQQAEDLLQDTFIKVWLNMPHYNSEKASLPTWLATITRNLALDALRSQQVRFSASNYLKLITDTTCYATVNDGPLNRLLMSRLAPQYRIVVELVYYKDYTRQEIANELNLPLGTVKTRVRIALQQLKQVLGQDIRHYHACT